MRKLVITNWDKRFLDLAKHISSWSKDPSTKVGAVITDGWRTVLGHGYNGFPIGVCDLEERYNDRPTKLAYTVHAELNAILNSHSDLAGATIYVWPLFTCNECAKAIIQSSICRVVAPKPNEERFAAAYEVAKQMYQECGVTYDIAE